MRRPEKILLKLHNLSSLGALRAQMPTLMAQGGLVQDLVLRYTGVPRP